MDLWSMTSMTQNNRGPMVEHAGAFMRDMEKPCDKPECIRLWTCYCKEDAIRAAEEASKPASMPRSEMCYHGQNCLHCTHKGRSRPSGKLVCNYHALSGSPCGHGEKCKFLHLAGKSLEDYQKCHRIPVSGRISNWNGKRYGKCKIPNCKGDCTFGHDASGVTKKPCRYGEKCKNRDSGCKFGHGATTTVGATNSDATTTVGAATNSDNQDDDVEDVIAEGVVKRSEK